MKARSYLLLLFLQFLCLFAMAQKQYLKFTHLDINDGMSQNHIISILQDSRGFMWFGTRDGLNKYDGYKFTVYKNDTKDSNSISNNFISGILEDASGIIWIASRGGGLNRYDKAKDKFTHFKNNAKNANSISSDLLTAISKDSQGNLWISTENGLNYFDPRTNIFYATILIQDMFLKIAGINSGSEPMKTALTCLIIKQKNLLRFATAKQTLLRFHPIMCR